MNKSLKTLCSIFMLLSLASCNEDPQPFAEKKGVTVPDFSITIGGKTVTDEMMASYPVYEAIVTSVNSYGTEKTTTYIGYKLNDAILAAGLSETGAIVVPTATDEYSVELAYTASEHDLIGLYKDGVQFTSYPWFAPCDSDSTVNFIQDCYKIEFKSSEKKDDKQTEGDFADPVKKDKTGSVTFSAFSFKINDQVVDNAALAGVNVYKITVDVANKSGVRSEHTYGGYLLKDVLSKLGITATSITVVCNDSSESTLDLNAIQDEFTLIAIECDKAVSGDGSIWIAQCSSHESKKYLKKVVELKTAN